MKFRGLKMMLFNPLLPFASSQRQIVTMGSHDTLEDKTVTVCCGSDFVNVTFINFSCTRKEIAQVRIAEHHVTTAEVYESRSLQVKFRSNCC